MLFDQCVRFFPSLTLSHTSIFFTHPSLHGLLNIPFCPQEDCLLNPDLSRDFLTLRAAKNNLEFLQSTHFMLFSASLHTLGAPPFLGTFHPHSSHPPGLLYSIPGRCHSSSFPSGNGFGFDNFIYFMWSRTIF